MEIYAGAEDLNTLLANHINTCLGKCRKHTLCGIFLFGKNPPTATFCLLKSDMHVFRKAAATANSGLQAIGSWARQVYASLGKSRQVG